MTHRPRGSRRVALSIFCVRCAIGALCASVFVGTVAGQDPGTEPEQDQRKQDEGKIVRAIDIDPPTDSAASIIRLLKTKVGQPLRAADVNEDLHVLWSRLQIRARLMLEDAEDGVRAIFEIVESQAYDRYVFKGLEHFTQREVRALLALDPRQRLNSLSAEKYATTLKDRYRRNGFAFVSIRIEEDPDQSLLTFFVDEGPKVTVREVNFRGNRAFPATSFLRLTENLIGGSGMESKPANAILRGSAYSVEVIEEDLDRLRFYYRRQGFRDAQVELSAARFTADRSEVDLTFRVVEGRRYTVASVDLAQTAPRDRLKPIYPKEEVLAVVKLKPGDYYDHEKIEYDKEAITKFYGMRGHPQHGRYGTGIEDAFRISDPEEVFDVDKAEVRVTYKLDEGTPKTLRDVKIRGNTYTRDPVIRRNVFLYPGDRLDMTEVDRSLTTLDSLRYFQNPQDFSGVRFELLPVEGDPDQIDLAIDVQEGNTGSFLWGAGISSANGLQARFVLSKRNFDISRLPSSIDPITVVSEIADNKAFHGGGQDLELMLAPGTQLSMFQISFFEPDLFGQHIDTIGLRLQAYRQLRFLDSFELDSLGLVVGLNRNFGQNVSVGVSFREETVDIDNIDANAPTIVFDAEGSTEMRGMRLTGTFRDVDFLLRPSEGYDISVYAELVGGPFGSDESFVKAGERVDLYVPLYRDTLDRAHVLHLQQRFDIGTGIDGTDDLYLTERFYMGGSTLRGFDQRRAGPTQFGEPTGGEVRLLGRAEYNFPLVSTRRAGALRQSEILRGVLFTDFGMLGYTYTDLEQPRLSAGLGVRIQVPLLNVPIALDLGWPILDEETDRQRQFFFSLARF